MIWIPMVSYIYNYIYIYIWLENYGEMMGHEMLIQFNDV